MAARTSRGRSRSAPPPPSIEDLRGRFQRLLCRGVSTADASAQASSRAARRGREREERQEEVLLDAMRSAPLQPFERQFVARMFGSTPALVYAAYTLCQRCRGTAEVDSFAGSDLAQLLEEEDGGLSASAGEDLFRWVQRCLGPPCWLRKREPMCTCPSTRGGAIGAGRRDDSARSIIGVAASSGTWQPRRAPPIGLYVSERR